MIEEYFPTMPKLEMFARGPARLGWGAWGNEVAVLLEERDRADEGDPRRVRVAALEGKA